LLSLLNKSFIYTSSFWIKPDFRLKYQVSFLAKQMLAIETISTEEMQQKNYV